MPSIGISLSSDPKAVSRFESRRAVPSTMSSAEWERVAPALREKAFFSARVNDAEVLGKMRELIGQAVDSAKRDPRDAYMSQDKFISEMKSFLASRGYKMGGSKLTDITSRRRLALIYDMNVEEAREYGRYVRGQDDEILSEFPAQEFLRVERRSVPRGDWPERWRAAGGKVYRGRMVALKSDAVWEKLSRFGRPYPPFDYGSGMGVRDIDRDEAIELGLLPKDEPVDEIPDFDVALEAEVSLERIPEELLDEVIAQTPNARVEGGKLKMSDKPQLPTWEDGGLESSRSWRGAVMPLREDLVDAADAKKKLKGGFSVSSPIGSLSFDESVLKHWEETLKNSSDIYGRLERMNVAADAVREALEIWQLPNGQRMYLNIFENASGKVRGIAVAESDNRVVRTWFVNKIQELDKCRKGELIYKR